MSRLALVLVSVAVLLFCQVAAKAEVVIETVTVGNPGNPPDDLHGDCYGGVNYVYDIGKFEITAGQYTEFLNAVAAEDDNHLYDVRVDLERYPNNRGCNIVRSGSPGNYTYSVDARWADRPVNYVNWGDAARFCNWLHNGQPTGAQDLTTTEDGSYFLNFALEHEPLMAVMRAPDATWVIPTEDEWYKAAYYYNDGEYRFYYTFPTSTHVPPTNGNPEGDTGNSANFKDFDWTIGSPYWRTEVGFFGLSSSHYGTFDQGGNVWEWLEDEEACGIISRAMRGGSFDDNYQALYAAVRSGASPNLGLQTFGFRVARIPRRADLDRDGDVDLADFALFQAAFTGPTGE